MTTPPGATDDQLIRRAMIAWLRTGGTGQEAFGRTVLGRSTADGVASLSGSSVEEADGHRYVVLRGGGSVIAIFRVQNRGELRRLKRPPQELLR